MATGRAGPRPVDRVQALSLPVPSLVTCELLGASCADHDFLPTRSAVLLPRVVAVQELQWGLRVPASYIDRLVATKELAPTDDLLGRRTCKQQEKGAAGHEAPVSPALLLLVVGHDSSANTISMDASAPTGR